jgi:radical SAM superfamily enzyme
MNRGHSAEDFEKCARQIKKDCPEIDLSAHLILGFPGETAQDWLDSALFAIASGAQGLKFHHLHAFPGTPLYDMTLKNQIILPQLDDYVEKIIFLLERIPATTVIHRLSASSMQEVLPLWTMEAQKTRHLILKKMEEKNTFQGKFYFPLNPGP